MFRAFITYHQEDPEIEKLGPADFRAYLKARKNANNFIMLDKKELTVEQKQFLGDHPFLVRRKGSDGNKVANRDLKEFRAMFRWANREEIIRCNPVVNLGP